MSSVIVRKIFRFPVAVVVAVGVDAVPLLLCVGFGCVRGEGNLIVSILRELPRLCHCPAFDTLEAFGLVVY